MISVLNIIFINLFYFKINTKFGLFLIQNLNVKFLFLYIMHNPFICKYKSYKQISLI